MWNEIIEGECNGYNYYDADSEYSVNGWEDDSRICPSEIPKLKNKPQKWKCKDGTTMLISEMTDKHLENSINYCNRNRNNSAVIILTNEKNRRLLEKQKEELKNENLNVNFVVRL